MSLLKANTYYKLQQDHRMYQMQHIMPIGYLLSEGHVSQQSGKPAREGDCNSPAAEGPPTYLTVYAQAYNAACHLTRLSHFDDKEIHLPPHDQRNVGNRKQLNVPQTPHTRCLAISFNSEVPLIRKDSNTNRQAPGFSRIQQGR
jgi:hypothetical protein